MKRFLIYISVFAFILQLPVLLEVFLPDNFFTFRPGEAINAKYTAIYGPHYSNKRLTMEEVAGFSIKTPYQIKRKTTTITDKIGYRNRILFENPDVVLIGDSQTVGVGSDQDEIFSEQIMDSLNLKVYNIAAAEPKELFQLIHDSLISKPKLVIMEKIEREIPYFHFDMSIRTGKVSEILKFISLNPITNKISEYTSKYFRNYTPHYLRAELVGRREFPKSILNDSIFFLESEKSEIKLPDMQIQKIADEYIKLDRYFKANKIVFIFMPFPNKETILWEHVPFNKQPDFLNKFISVLEANQVKVINPIPVLNKCIDENRNPYIYDDIHYGIYGMKSVSELMIDEINVEIKAEKK
ncbi:MAG: hypothetical protein H6604_04860 [Flavobacteriales bacterium]|nr:hypothetical protein [Flavobacteriales bacterium]